MDDHRKKRVDLLPRLRVGQAGQFLAVRFIQRDGGAAPLFAKGLLFFGCHSPFSSPFTVTGPIRESGRKDPGGSAHPCRECHLMSRPCTGGLFNSRSIAARRAGIESSSSTSSPWDEGEAPDFHGAE